MSLYALLGRAPACDLPEGEFEQVGAIAVFDSDLVEDVFDPWFLWAYLAEDVSRAIEDLTPCPRRFYRWDVCELPTDPTTGEQQWPSSA